MTDKILNDISHRRFNPLRGSWVLVSPHRTKRPWKGQEESPVKNNLPGFDPKCTLCPGNVRDRGDQNPAYEDIFVFVNDFSAVKEYQAEYSPEESPEDVVASELLRAQPVTGKCYVMTFSARHNVTLADMSVDAIVPVVRAWTELYRTHLSPSSPLLSSKGPSSAPSPAVGLALPPAPSQQLRHMAIFENKGPAMGCSNPHPHCQVWTTSHLPEEPALELPNLVRYRAEHGGRNMLADYLALELEKGERVVWQNEWFAALCPWWAVWPFEILILPKRHVRALVDLTAEEQRGLAEAIQEVARRYDNLFECSFPYSSGLHQAPLEGSCDEIESSYLHMHWYPPLLRSATVRKFLVGFELMAEPQRDITPEQATVRLRNSAGPLYRDSLG